MALIHNNLLSVFSGVSKQSLDQRLPNNCEEMINAYPTVQYGIRRRNPTSLISNSILTEKDQFVHTYDRGLSGESTEEYVITIDRVNGLRVLDVTTGSYNTVTYTGNSLSYLESSNPEIGFSAITIKDTTFIANKDIVPTMYGTGIDSGTSTTFNYKRITINTTGYTTGYSTLDSASGYGYGIVSSSSVKNNLAPSRILTGSGYFIYPNAVYAESSVGATTTITVDGVDIKYVTAVKLVGANTLPESIYEYRANIYNTLVSQLDGNKYRVVLSLNGGIDIYKTDTTAITVTVSITMPTNVTEVPPAVSLYSGLASWSVIGQQNIGAGAITSITSGTTSGILPSSSMNGREAFIWIKYAAVDPLFKYSYTVSIYSISGTLLGTTTITDVNSNTIATGFYTWANTITGFVASISGSICRIQRIDGQDFTIVISDTYGNEASSVFKGSVSSMNDLPRHFPFKGTIMKIEGVDSYNNSSYWIRYNGNSWVEHIDPNMNNIIISSTMPHKLVRNADYTFTLSEITYDNILVGDSDSQPMPEFIGSPIKDLFFTNGRLGILTKNGISLSQQGVFTNFFRTTVLTLLDDSAITTYIDSNKSVGLEFAIELQGKMVFFGDKQQFIMDGSKGITPSNLAVSAISGYEINTNVRPISIGDSIMFATSVGNYSSLYEMTFNNITSNIQAEDISSHVPNYIDKDITQIVGSKNNSCVFLKSRSKKDTIYLYKFHIQDGAKKQSSWSKWIFSYDINSIFTFGRNLFLFGSRYNELVATEDFTFVNTIKFDRDIIFNTYFSYGDIIASPSFEKIDIDPYSVTANFKDNGVVDYNSEIELSEWALIDKQSVKEIRGTLLIKTAEISSEEGSDFNLVVEDKERKTTRIIPSVYTVDRKPYISGNTKNMNIKIASNSGYGFQINSISLEGQYNARSTKL